MRQSDRKKHYNWFVGADMYLAAACILCNEMLVTYKCSNDYVGNSQNIDKNADLPPLTLIMRCCYRLYLILNMEWSFI